MAASPIETGEGVMTSTQDTIQDSVATIWSSILGLEARPTDKAVAFTSRGNLTGCILITGRWQGAVTLDCPEALAARATAVMFGLDRKDVDRDQTYDALGELTNMIAGNFKSLLPQPCDLSLPTVTQGTDYAFRIIDSEVVNRFGFECDDYPFVVTIFKSCK
jgi:chemotaxis protein CheX